jgi:hypothetical protein
VFGCTWNQRILTWDGKHMKNTTLMGLLAVAAIPAALSQASEPMPKPAPTEKTVPKAEHVQEPKAPAPAPAPSEPKDKQFPGDRMELRVDAGTIKRK